jgi:GTP-binding protein
MHILDATYLISSPNYTLCPPPDKPEYAFIGRSNVGKSSLINMLCHKQQLAKTSGAPGKTQMINHFMVESVKVPATAKSKLKGEQWYLVDLPGYGFAKVSQTQRKSWTKMIEDYLRKRTNLGMVFILIDSRHAPQKVDLDFVNQLGEWDVPFSLVFTKTDKETQSVVAKNVQLFLQAMRETWQFLPRHFMTSAVKKTGRDKILSFLDECNTDFFQSGNSVT